MSRRISWTLPALLAVATWTCAGRGAGPVPDSQAGPSEADKIERLLEAVRKSDLRFIRNGEEHTGPEAEAHLRRKLEYAAGEVRTAREFIDEIATRSSLTGEPYQVRLRDGRTVPAGLWFHEQLEAIESGEDGTALPGSAAAPRIGTIEEVLASIRQSPLVFLRVEKDGVERRAGPAMAAHIALKYQLAGSPDLPVREFVEAFCSRSLVHGTDYLVELPDRRTVRLHDWLLRQIGPDPAAGAAGPGPVPD